jgi:hypothetical protein|tara:strand:- start:109 stop:477 length:369 start_codon:yes stop_codon:yes gene_type:complete
MHNLTVVTEPNIYVMDQPSFLTIGNSSNNLSVCEFLRNMDKNITVYVGNEDSDLTWLLNSSASSDYILLDTQVDSFLTGLFIDKPKTYYYNNDNKYKEINIQEIEDPIRFLIEWSLEQKEIT